MIAGECIFAASSTQEPGFCLPEETCSPNLTAKDFKINVLQTFPSPFDFQLRLEEQVPLNTGVAQVILLCCLSRKAVPRWAVYWHSCGGLRMYQIAHLTDILWCC